MFCIENNLLIPDLAKYWPIRGQYWGHVISVDQSKASIPAPPASGYISWGACALISNSYKVLKHSRKSDETVTGGDVYFINLIWDLIINFGTTPSQVKSINKTCQAVKSSCCRKLLSRDLNKKKILHEKIKIQQHTNTSASKKILCT